jgi:hypothetical protein
MDRADPPIACLGSIKNPVREKSKFVKRFNADSAVQPPTRKYFYSAFQKYMHLCAIPPR